MDLSTIVEIAVGVATVMSTLATALGAVWLFFRNKIRAWWAPYRAGVAGMAEIPGIREDIQAARAEIEIVRASQGMLSLQMRARGDTNIEAAEFECGADGANTYVNQTYARWLGVGKAELLGWGWVNFVHPDDRIGVRREWDDCRAEHRVFSMRYRLLDSDGLELRVMTLIVPIPESPPAKQWLGVIRRIVA